ncbi:LOW QUALITY PROTEIN: hepatocyte cell adhesion molecule-like [Tachyglossus aculeatus]|uniref:LOW QUALITY PROTEIN: hepatocyte cell adhesion molecule-like n=1 Tax=Tachyglossus aculeatus TaxID=9261 RepID=UPI0018F598DA|nr:LOW QUALITY PROTEIN: hepatocyte cell adhesion molecule-like [Tachyglossus aculeatus]
MGRERLLVLLSAVCFLAEVMMDQLLMEIHGALNTSVLLPGQDIALSSVFSVEWRIKLSQEVLILSFSPSSKNSYTNAAYQQRISFSPTNFSLQFHNLQCTDEGFYTLAIQLQEKFQVNNYRTRLTVSIPISSVLIIASEVSPRAGANITLRCLAAAGSPVIYSWQRVHQTLLPGNRSILSQDNSTLTLLDVQLCDEGKYRCLAENAISVEFEEFTLKLNDEVTELQGCYITCPSHTAGASSCPTSSYVNYFGYPGYLGYILLIVYLIKMAKKIKTRLLATQTARDTQASSERGGYPGSLFLGNYYITVTQEDEERCQLQDAREWKLLEGRNGIIIVMS